MIDVSITSLVFGRMQIHRAKISDNAPAEALPGSVGDSEEIARVMTG